VCAARPASSHKQYSYEGYNIPRSLIEALCIAQLGFCAVETVLLIHGAFMAQARAYCAGMRDPRKANQVSNELSVKDLVPHTWKGKVDSALVFQPKMAELFVHVTHYDDKIGKAAGSLVKKRKRVEAAGANQAM
jgi:hypothetical protein